MGKSCGFHLMTYGLELSYSLAKYQMKDEYEYRMGQENWGTNILFKNSHVIYECSLNNCEAQGKGRARGGPRKVTERSFIDS